MKIAFSATGRNLDAELDPRFGRCACFILATTDDGQFQVLDNSGANLGGGAGIQAARSVADAGAETVVTGNCGPNAMQVLSAAGIQTVTGASGKIRDLLDRFTAGELAPSAPTPAGTVRGMPAMGGAGIRGMGRGGGGCGRGGGGGMGRRRQAPDSPSAPESPEARLRRLKQEAQRLEAEAQALRDQIKRQSSS